MIASLVSFHSAFQLRTPIATTSTISLAMVVLTGVLGRLLHFLAPSNTQQRLTAAIDAFESEFPGMREDLVAALAQRPGPRVAMTARDHNQTGRPLEGGHKGPACSKCHTKTSPLGKPQFVATPTACGQCHADPHKGRFSAACQKCHNVTKWEQFNERAFDHAVTRYPLPGMHAPVACDKCHGAP